MKKWCKAILFILPLLCLVAAVNWYVDSYAYLRITYDRIGGQMAVNSMNVAGLEESDFNDRKLLLACLKQQKEAKKVLVAGSSRVMNFDHIMFDADSFYNAGLSESTIYDLLAVVGILEQQDRVPEKMIIGADAFLFNSSHNNERWKELEEYVTYMKAQLGRTDGGGAPEQSIGTAGDGVSKQMAETEGDGMTGQFVEAADDGAPVHLEERSNDVAEQVKAPQVNTGRDNAKWLSLDYFRYNVTLLPEHKRFAVDYTQDWESDRYLKHYDGSIAYQSSLREVDVNAVTELTEQSIAEHVVYRMTDFKEIDEESVALLAGLIDYLLSRNVEVILYLPPYSPMMYNYIESEEQYQITFQVEERLRRMASDKGVALYGSYDPAGCGLEMTDLYDIYHVKTEKMPDTFYPVIVP